MWMTIQPACGYFHPGPCRVTDAGSGTNSVAVVQVAVQSGGRLGFRLLILERPAYAQFLRDPFAVSDRFPPDWSASGLLPAR